MKQTYNVRLVKTSAGELKLGFVMGFYAGKGNVTHIKDVPESVRVGIAKKLGVKLL
jgi:hypothetical protein